MYVLSTGCQWRALPKDLPPRSIVHAYLKRWEYDSTLHKIHHSLYQQCHEQVKQETSPTACIIDSQSVKGAEKGGTTLIQKVLMRGRKSVVSSAMGSVRCTV